MVERETTALPSTKTSVMAEYLPKLVKQNRSILKCENNKGQVTTSVML